MRVFPLLKQKDTEIVHAQAGLVDWVPTALCETERSASTKDKHGKAALIFTARYPRNSLRNVKYGVVNCMSCLVRMADSAEQ